MPTEPYCISSSRSASASGDLFLVRPLMVKYGGFDVNQRELKKVRHQCYEDSTNFDTMMRQSSKYHMNQDAGYISMIECAVGH